MTHRFRVLVCGGHRFVDPIKVKQWLIDLAPSHLNEIAPSLDWTIEAVIEGDADGADRGGKLWALDVLKIVPHTFPADWDRYGNGAGPIRNRRMLLEGLPNVVFAFPGRSGTADMVRQTNEMISQGANIALFKIYGNFQ